jgi:hypothetical protein
LGTQSTIDLLRVITLWGAGLSQTIEERADVNRQYGGDGHSNE